jgi:hypothetical protein
MQSLPNLKSHRWMVLICLSLLFSGAAAAPGLTQQVPPPNIINPVPIEASPSRAVIDAIQKDLAAKFGVTSPINVLNFSVQMWPDGCLGLGKDEPCTLATVTGWRITVSDREDVLRWTYRTDTTGANVRIESSNRELPPNLAQTLLKRVAKETRISVSKLKIAEVKPATFSGCLGIYRPNQACTMIALPGWQTIVTSPKQTFVYHLTTDARIVQNTTASGADSKIRVSFELFGGQPPALESKDIVFRSKLFGGNDGRMTTITLTEDGRVTESTTILNNRPTSIVRKTITPKQVAQFKRLLENQRFPNFNGLSYLTSAALADYPTTTYQSQFTVTQFIDLEKKRLPRSYQQVINAWEKLIRR